MIRPGDRVRYSSKYCRQLGAVSGWLPQARGTVTRLWGAGDRLAAITWDYNPDGPGSQGGAGVDVLQRLTPSGWLPRS